MMMMMVMMMVMTLMTLMTMMTMMIVVGARKRHTHKLLLVLLQQQQEAHLHPVSPTTLKSSTVMVMMISSPLPW